MIRHGPLLVSASMLVFSAAAVAASTATPRELERDLEEGNQAWVVGLKTGNADLIAGA